MICPNCQASIREDSNFCEKCGTPLKNRRSRGAKRGVIGGAWTGFAGFWANMWQENKPGFFILSILLLAMFSSIGYFIYSRTTGRFVVTVEKISREEGFDLNVRNALKVYCREFSRECAERGKNQVDKDIRLVLRRILIPVKTLDAKITYKNNTKYPVHLNRFLSRISPDPWRGNPPGDSLRRYAPKLQRLRLAIEMTGGNVSFESKVDYADTLALTENHGSITIRPGEEKSWRIGYVEGEEFQIEYVQNGKLYRTPALRLR